jgi:hypothetical protein
MLALSDSAYGIRLDTGHTGKELMHSYLAFRYCDLAARRRAEAGVFCWPLMVAIAASSPNLDVAGGLGIVIHEFCDLSALPNYDKRGMKDGGLFAAEHPEGQLALAPLRSVLELLDPDAKPIENLHRAGRAVTHVLDNSRVAVPALRDRRLLPTAWQM